MAALSSVGFFANRLSNALNLQARQLLGADAVLVSDNPINNTIRETIQQAGGNAHWLLADLAREDQQDALVEQAFAWKKRIDIWVNNAGADVLTGDARNWSFEKKERIDHQRYCSNHKRL